MRVVMCSNCKKIGRDDQFKEVLVEWHKGMPLEEKMFVNNGDRDIVRFVCIECFRKLK